MRRWLAGQSFYYGWVVAFACFLVNGVVFGMTYSFGVFLDPLVSTFEASTARTSLVFGVQLFVLYTAAGPMGGLVDWLGPRRSLLVAAAVLAAGMVVGAGAGSLLVLVLAYGVVAGLGLSLAYVIAYATAPQWFLRNRGLATGIASAGLGVGMVVVAPTASYLVTAFGWRGAFPLLATGLVAILLVAALLMADDPEHVDAAIGDEFPDGRPNGGDDSDDRLDAVKDVVRSRAFVLLFFGYILMYVPLYVLLNHLVNYAAGQGIRETGVLALSVVGGTTTVVRLAVGSVADDLGRVTVYVVCGCVMSAALFLVPLAVAPIPLLAVAVVFGIGYGGTGALISSVVADLFGGENLNTLFGLVSFAFAIPGLVAPPAAGLGFDRLGTYTPVFAAAAAVGLTAMVLIAGAGRAQGEL